jgi:hypothetical protein
MRLLRRPHSLRLLWLFAVVLVIFAAVRLRPLMLIVAARTGNVPLARLALRLGVSPRTMTSGLELDDAFNALMGGYHCGGIPRPVLVLAAIGCHPGVVRLLLDAGADPNRSDGAGSPLVFAAIGGDPECIRLLLRHGADPNGHYKDNSSVLDSLPYPPNPTIVAMLKQAGAKE